jgi:dihydrofolate reductase
MKTILWATLSANGNYATSSPEHPPKPEALADFATRAHRSGNFIAGRKTFDGFRANGADKAFQGIDIVVVSASAEEIQGVKVVRSPKEALNYLESRGHQVALLTGGETLHNSFLEEDLIDEVVFTIAPVLEGGGLQLALPRGQYKNVLLSEFIHLGNGVVQLNYKIRAEKTAGRLSNHLPSSQWEVT